MKKLLEIRYLDSQGVFIIRIDTLWQFPINYQIVYSLSNQFIRVFTTTKHIYVLSYVHRFVTFQKVNSRFEVPIQSVRGLDM
jgi:hypothetical protein